MLDGFLTLLAYDLQLLAICVDCGVTRGCRLSICRVSVGCALVLFGRLAEILVLKEKVSEPVVDRRRLRVSRKGLEIVAVPAESLMIIRQLLVRFLRALILSVVMRRKVLQVSLQIGQHFRQLFRLVVPPVFRLQSILGRKVPLRLQNELGESALGESLHHAHAEAWGSRMERMERYESVVCLCGVIVAQFRQIVLAKIAVNAVFIGSALGAGEVLLDRIRPAEVAEAQADGPRSIGDAAFVLFLVLLTEVVAGRHLIIEQRHVSLQGLLV